jgi:lipoprotein-anchoring transpeptidase ErfK/SrfK
MRRDGGGAASGLTAAVVDIYRVAPVSPPVAGPCFRSRHETGSCSRRVVVEYWAGNDIAGEGTMETSTVRATRRNARRTGVPWRMLTATIAVGGVLLTGACTGGSSPSWQGGAGKTDGGNASATPASPTITASITSPAANAKDVPAASDIAFTADDVDKPTVDVKDSSGTAVTGTLLPDGKTWRPDEALSYGTTYTATITGTNSDGKTGSVASTFTTMAKPTNLVRITSFLGDGQTVGVGMPMIVRFGRAVPAKYRAGVQARMIVTTTPQQEGIWNWISPTEVHYRPKSYWQANTKIFYKVQLAGVPMGDDWYGRSDLTVNVKVGRSLIMTVENKTKQMTVTENGKVINTIPVSLGKKSTPSSSGTMLVIEKKRKTVFDTMKELGPKKGYRDNIDFAQRITWSGQFIHAAPWSEGNQGKVNVSHGCVNVSMKMGAWLFARTMLGDPITVKGTEEKLQNGNGWTDWNVSWATYIQGSALPVTA